MYVAAFTCVQPVVEVLQEEPGGALERIVGVALYLVQGGMAALQRGHVALVDELFLGFDVVVEAGFGQPQALGDVLEGGCPGAFGIKQLGCLRQNGNTLGIVLGRAVKRG